MSMASRSEEDAELRVLLSINSLLAETTPNRIPQLVPRITQQLTTCKTIFNSAEGSSKTKSDIGVTIHKFKTKLSSFLNDRSVEARWAATVLIKSAIEIGGWEMLKDCKGWVTGLIANLKKPDPPSSKKNAMIALTRIFMLSKDYPSLTREVTTPSLQPFVGACLNHFQHNKTEWAIRQTLYQRALLETMLECFSLLIPRHPTTFRTVVSQIRAIAILVISQSSPKTGNEDPTWLAPVNVRTMKLGQRVFIQLHLCAPKNGAAEEWDSTHELVVRSIHVVANEIFRAVTEFWTTSSDMPRPNRSAELASHPFYPHADGLGNPGWVGIAAGVERMISLLGLLQQYIDTPTSADVSLRLGLVCSLLTRLFSVTVPRPSDGTQLHGLDTFNKQVSAKEREELFSSLPRIHAAAIHLVRAIVRRFGLGSMPLCPVFLDQLVWVFEAEHADMELREATYNALTEILKAIGPSLSTCKVGQMEMLAKHCSSDAIISDSITTKRESSSAVIPKTNGTTTTIDPTSIMETPTERSAPATSYDALQLAARTLISTILLKIPAEKIPQSVRDRLDNAAVSSGDEQALTASALNPPPLRSSILPSVASIHPESLQVEAILRPRMPVIFADTTESTHVEHANGVSHVEPSINLEAQSIEMSKDQVTHLPKVLSSIPSIQQEPWAVDEPLSSPLKVPSAMAGGEEELNLNEATQLLDVEAGMETTYTTPDGLTALEAALDAASSPEQSIKPTEALQEEEIVEYHEDAQEVAAHGRDLGDIEMTETANQEEDIEEGHGVDRNDFEMSKRETGREEDMENVGVERNDFEMSETRAGKQKATDVDSDDSDEFEIPPLVFRKDFEHGNDI